MPTKRKRDKKPVNCVTFGVLCILGLIFLFHTPVLAHKVYIYAWLEGDTVYTESYFGAKKKVKMGLIRVFDLSGQKLLEGRTDEKGEFSFKPPLLTDFRIVIEAGMGHKGEFVLKAEKPEGHSGTDIIQDVTGKGKKISVGSVSTDEARIQTIVENALDSRLKPVMRQLAEIRKEKGPGFNEIIGGIGYILGLMGLVLYFKSRNKT